MKLQQVQIAGQVVAVDVVDAVERLCVQLSHPGRPAGKVVAVAGIGQVKGKQQKQASAEPPQVAGNRVEIRGSCDGFQCSL